MEEFLRDSKYRSSLPAGNLLVKGPSLNNWSANINSSSYRTVEEASLRQSLVLNPSTFDSLSGNLLIESRCSQGLAAGAITIFPSNSYAINHPGSLTWPSMNVGSQGLGAGVISLSPSDSYAVNHPGSLTWPSMNVGPQGLGAGVISLSPSDSYAVNHPGSLTWPSMNVGPQGLGAGVISLSPSDSYAVNHPSSLTWPSMNVGPQGLGAGAISLSPSDSYLVSSSDFLYQNQRVDLVGYVLSSLDQEIRRFRDYLVTYRESFDDNDETWEKLSKALQRLIFCRGLTNKSLVKILAFIAKLSQIQMFGKGIEGFITYKTWARPPCGQHISMFIDMLSRPGNYSWEMSHA